MKKIKRFVLNDSFTVLSAEAQKKVLGGDGYPPVCSENSQGTCSGYCVQTPEYAGVCSWVPNTGCRCVGYTPWMHG